MFGIKTTVRPGPVGGRRYDGNPYSKLRERNKREAKEWRGQITRAPYVNKEQTQARRIRWWEKGYTTVMKELGIESSSSLQPAKTAVEFINHFLHPRTVLAFICCY